MAHNDREIKKQNFVKALLISENVVSAAKQAGISERTARRWLAGNEVKEALQQARQETFKRDLRFLRAALPTAIRTLIEHMNTAGIPSGTRVRAAQILLDNSLAAYRLFELEERLLRIEERLGGSGGERQL